MAKENHMKAIVLKEPKRLELMDVAPPHADGENVIIDVLACGICGSDIHYWEMGFGMAGVQDLILGHEFCGTVSDPGARGDLLPGDRVTYIPLNPCGGCPTCAKGLFQLCPNSWKRSIPGNNAPGAFAEKVALRADMVRKLPTDISDDEACLIEPAAVALHAVHQAGVAVGETVLIIGGGTIGLLSAAWAKVAGASLVGICEVNPHRIEAAKNSGFVHAVFDGRDGKIKRQLKEASGGGFDKVVETSATDAGIAVAVSALRACGTFVLAGINFSRQAVPTLAMTSKELVQKGSMAYRINEFETAGMFISEKRLDLRALVNRTVGFEGVQDVFEQLHAGEPTIIKAVLRPGS